MEQAVMAYKSVAESNELRESLRLSELARHNEASALAFAERKKAIEMAICLRDNGVDATIISKASGLSIEEILAL
jgi:predicted Fe-Mo cluster-binding NifX family protein